MIKWLLKRIFRERPSLPKYTVTYDVNIIFAYFRKLPPIEHRSLELITKSTAGQSGQRSQSLESISLDHFVTDGGKYVFYI